MVCWGGDSFLLNTKGHSYMFPLSTLHTMEKLSKVNVGLWQLNLIIDLAKMAKRYLGCPVTWQPQDRIWHVDGMLRGDLLPEMAGLFTPLHKRVAVTVVASTFSAIWFAHMPGEVGGHAGAAPGLAQGGRLENPAS